ncbi:MAG: c-type cytochrome [Acidobacteriota bacterium]
MIKPFVAGMVVGLCVPPLGAFLFIELGHPPVAVADPPFPYEKKLARGALHARIGREMPGEAPFAAGPGDLDAGARIYRDQCAACHGAPGKKSSFAASMFPHAPQLFEKHRDAIGVSDDPPGETYWKVKNGIRLSGMPAYERILSDAEMWQVTLLLASADKLPDERAAVLRGSAP